MAHCALSRWPFFDEDHRAFATGLRRLWLRRERADDEADADARCRAWVRALARGGALRACVPARRACALDVRTLCASRAKRSRTRARWPTLPSQCRAWAAERSRYSEATNCAPLFASRRCGRSDRRVRALRARSRIGRSRADDATARRDGDTYVLDGEKTWISNAGIADFYVVFARTGGDGAKGLSAFAVDAQTPASTVAERIETISPHPLGVVRFEGARDSRASLGSATKVTGFKIAMATLDVFRSTVGAAALGFARRALDESVAHANVAQAFRRAARRAATHASGDRRNGDRRRAARATRLSRGMDEGLPAPRASRARPRWRSGSRPKRPDESAIAPCSCSAAAASPGESRRTAIPRRPRVAHLRRCERNSTGRDRAANARGA